MTINRRRFLRTAGGVALLGLGGPLGLAGNGASALFGEPRKNLRVAVLLEEDFPHTDSLAITRADLSYALSDHTVQYLTADQVVSGLNAQSFDIFINPYGSSFPEICWTAIRTFLSVGGDLINLGGVPFSIPAAKQGRGWKKGVPQTAYHRQLGITQSYLLSATETGELSDYENRGTGNPVAAGCSVLGVYELYYRFTSTRDYPDEDGSAGQRDAEVSPLVTGISGRGDMVSAPVVIVDRLQGEFAGGRWLLANFTGSMTRESLRNLVRLASSPHVRFSVHPTFATYLPGETPALTVRGGITGHTVELEGECRIILSGGNGAVLEERRISLRRDAWESPIVLAGNSTGTLKPGFYAVRGEFSPRGVSEEPVDTVTYDTGFWIRDDALLNGQPRVTIQGGYFQREGRPFPVTGTSYMSSEVHRKFLFEPNPAVWERDFAEMKLSGINMVRTGIWTGWKNIMLDTGKIDEGTLRSLDAFMLTAARHGVPVIFTFFAFLPESWGGENPYLDPRSVAAQKVFISSIADRYRDAGGIIWDLINEPSFSSPAQLWRCRPNYDRHESSAWTRWQEEGLASTPPEERAALLRDRYRMTPGEDTGLPPLQEFDDRNIQGRHRSLRVSDYRLFGQEMFRRWSGELAETLREARTTPQLVTVGQDEGGTYERPGPHFFGDTVDFTCVHNWWYNDDLLWDTVMTTVPGKPNLVGETGVMFYESADGVSWRTEKEVRDLLERKLALSFAGGGAGYINWIWDTNPYMDSENEAAIGLKRADGTIKPEYEVMRRFAFYFRDQAALMESKSDEDVVMVIPHSNMFSVRSFAVEATRRAVRAMEYHCGVPLRAVSEMKLDTLGTVPAVLLFPSPQVIDRVAWEKMMALVRKGARLILSGPIDDDRFLIPARRSGELGLTGDQRPVAGEEHIVINDREFRVGFRGERIQKVSKYVLSGNPVVRPLVIGAGKGEVIYSPLPVELSDSVEATAAFYRYALDRSGVRRIVTVASSDASVLVRSVEFRRHVMLVFVSEASRPREISYTHTETGTEGNVTVPAQRTIVRFLRRRDGGMVSELDLTKEA